jgi:uncharacterized membrane protein YfcA
MKNLKVHPITLMLGIYMLGFSDQKMFDIIGSIIVLLAALTFFRDGLTKQPNSKEINQKQINTIKKISFVQIIIGILILMGGALTYWLKVNK